MLNSIRNSSGNCVNIFTCTQFQNLGKARDLRAVRKNRALQDASTALSLSHLCWFESLQYQRYLCNLRVSLLVFYQQNPRQRQTLVALLCGIRIDMDKTYAWVAMLYRSVWKWWLLQDCSAECPCTGLDFKMSRNNNNENPPKTNKTPAARPEAILKIALSLIVGSAFPGMAFMFKISWNTGFLAESTHIFSLNLRWDLLSACP